MLKILAVVVLSVIAALPANGMIWCTDCKGNEGCSGGLCYGKVCKKTAIMSPQTCETKVMYTCTNDTNGGTSGYYQSSDSMLKTFGYRVHSWRCSDASFCVWQRERDHPDWLIPRNGDCIKDNIFCEIKCPKERGFCRRGPLFTWECVCDPGYSMINNKCRYNLPPMPKAPTTLPPATNPPTKHAYCFEHFRGMQYPGYNTLASVAAFTEMECQGLCEVETLCVGYSFRTTGSKCYLKSLMDPYQMQHSPRHNVGIKKQHCKATTHAPSTKKPRITTVAASTTTYIEEAVNEHDPASFLLTEEQRAWYWAKMQATTTTKIPTTTTEKPTTKATTKEATTKPITTKATTAKEDTKATSAATTSEISNKAAQTESTTVTVCTDKEALTSTNVVTAQSTTQKKEITCNKCNSNNCDRNKKDKECRGEWCYVTSKQNEVQHGCSNKAPDFDPNEPCTMSNNQVTCYCNDSDYCTDAFFSSPEE